MKVKVCPKCGAHNDEGAWTCQNESCGEVLALSTLREIDSTEGDAGPSSPPVQPVDETPVELESTDDAGRTATEPVAVPAPALPSVPTMPGLQTQGSSQFQPAPVPWPTLLFLASGIVAFIGMGFLVSGATGGTDEFIRLAPIFMGIGIVMLAVVLALFAIGAQLERSWRESSEPRTLGSIPASTGLWSVPTPTGSGDLPVVAGQNLQQPMAESAPAVPGQRLPNVAGHDLVLARRMLADFGYRNVVYVDVKGMNTTPLSLGNKVVVKQHPEPGTAHEVRREVVLTIKKKR